MESGLLHLHNFLRWVILFFLLLALVQAFGKKSGLEENKFIVAGNDVNWDAAWAHFDGKFTSRQTKDLFSSYLPPNKFIGVKFIRKVLSF